ncbi:MAG: tRNA preQ1(34) S-adenosylmethionine ribosyltransferase-isomerase QueA [Proteobacteria bacterium]|nr:tRNA preQ1(34) S-adenosylmethionine ribosyltransferase-isomerase QueA [Pseudomonadota bacterium]
MHTNELHYDLPPELIAQVPLAERDAARLLCVDAARARFEHRSVRELAKLVPPSLWVLNDTKVIPARLIGHKSTGGRVELLLLDREDAIPGEERWTALGSSSRGFRPGTEIELLNGLLRARVRDVRRGRLRVLFTARQDAGPVRVLIERAGLLPLPPYIRRSANAQDAARYQTVYANQPGAVAAPTAGLHLTERLLAALLEHGHRIARITLHVGPGTFTPVHEAELEEHTMHEERYELSEHTAESVQAAKREGMPVLAVGTTVVRTLEAAAAGKSAVSPGTGSTALFIYPPYRFRVVDSLLTNFHLPRSTLLALVMAFGGVDLVRSAYAEAIEARYRFFSYGDAMLLHRSV